MIAITLWTLMWDLSVPSSSRTHSRTSVGWVGWSPRTWVTTPSSSTKDPVSFD